MVVASAPMSVAGLRIRLYIVMDMVVLWQCIRVRVYIFLYLFLRYRPILSLILIVFVIYIVYSMLWDSYGAAGSVVLQKMRVAGESRPSGKIAAMFVVYSKHEYMCIVT